MVQWLNSKIETIAGAAVILAGASFASKILGLIRNRVLAGTFGAGDTLDAYYAAFRIPDAIFQLVVLGALSAGFIPVFVELVEKKGDYWRVASSILNILLFILVILSGIFIIFTPALQSLIAPGFGAQKFQTTVLLARVMALGPIFLGISAVFSGILQSYRRFVVYALAPLFYNLGIIAGVIFFTPYFGIMGLGLGVVLGAVLHMAIQWPTVRAVGFRWQCNFDFRNKSVRAIGWLSVPRIIGLAVSQINLFVVTILASMLASGSLTVFNLAHDIQSVPLGLFAISLATAAFPALSECSAKRDWDSFRKGFSNTARLILFLTVPVAVMLLLLRAQIVRVLLGWGQFDWQDTITTADTLAFFSLSLFAQALLPLLARALYAMKDTISPLIAGVLGVGVNVMLALHFRDSLGVAGLALAFSIAMLVNLVVIWVMLRARIGSLDEARIVLALFKISIAALVMAIVMQVMKYVVAGLVNMQTGWGIFIQGLVSGGLGLLMFLLVSLALGSEEAQQIKYAFTKRVFRSKEARPVEIME